MPDIDTHVNTDVEPDVDSDVESDVNTDVDTDVEIDINVEKSQVPESQSSEASAVEVQVSEYQSPEVQSEESMTNVDWMNRVIRRWRQHLPLRVRFGNVTAQTLADGSVGPGPAELSGVLYDIREKTIMAPFELIGCVAVHNPFNFENLSFQYDASADALEVLPEAEHRLVIV